LNLEWLHDFLTAAETGNFSRAAITRNSSQAAFSRRIMSLEAWLGVVLFDRSVFPLRLTPQGERFRAKAVEIVQQVAEAKVVASNDSTMGRDLVRIAMPHGLATGRLDRWTSSWSQEASMRLSIVTGSIHDIVTALVAGSVDVLFAFSTPQQPLHLAPEQFERFVVGEEVLRPYASPAFIEKMPAPWPGTRRNPIPLLGYSTGVYLGRMADVIVENAPETLHSSKIFESELGDVLRSMAIGGHGVAFLPECCLEYTSPNALVPLGGKPWTLPLSVIAYIDRNSRRAAIQRFAKILAK